MPWNFEYEIEVEIEQPQYEVEIEYDTGYQPGWHNNHQVDWNAGHGYHQEPQVTVVEFNTGGWQNWGARPQGNAHQNWNCGWKGHFWQMGQKYPMNFQNFQIDHNGSMWGHGHDAVGQFNISGKMNQNRHFTFVKQYFGAHAVNYKGAMSNGHLAGHWSIPGQQPEKFQIRPDFRRWSGAFWQMGQRNQMVLDMDVSQFGVFGVGSDGVGDFNIRGECHGNQIKFAKHYWGQHTVFYQGTWQGNNIQGNWQIPGNDQGKFQLHH